VSLVVESTAGRVELEGPKEVVGLLEVGTTSVKFSDQVFSTDDLVLSESLFNDFVGSDGDSLLVDLTETSLVDQVRDSVSGGETVSDKRFDLLEHVKGSSVNSDQSGVVDLSESEQLEDLSDLRSQIVDTSDSDDKDDLRFGRDVERLISSSLSLEVNDFLLFRSVLLVVSFRSLGVFSSLGLSGFSSLS